MAREHVGRTILVVDGEPVHHRGAGFVQANHFHLRTFAPELDDYLVQRAHRGDIPEPVLAKRFDHCSISGEDSATGWNGHRRECVFPDPE